MIMRTKEFMSAQWTDKLTMTDGINNLYWDEIAAKVKKIETLATDLRAELEELSDMMYNEDCTIKDADGDCEGIDSDLVQDWAASVGEIENNFEWDK